MAVGWNGERCVGGGKGRDVGCGVGEGKESNKEMWRAGGGKDKREG